MFATSRPSIILETLSTSPNTTAHPSCPKRPHTHWYILEYPSPYPHPSASLRLLLTLIISHNATEHATYQHVYSVPEYYNHTSIVPHTSHLAISYMHFLFAFHTTFQRIQGTNNPVLPRHIGRDGVKKGILQKTSKVFKYRAFCFSPVDV